MTEIQNGAVDRKDPVVLDLEGRIDSLNTERTQVKSVLGSLDQQIKRYEKALRALEGEPKPRKVYPSDQKPRTTRTGISEERYAMFAADVLEYARDHEEFRQIDWRSQAPSAVNSGLSSALFDRMRQDNLIRVARQDGNNKYFRLTREAINAK